MNTKPTPDFATLQKIEEALHVMLAQYGETVASLQPHEISEAMRCAVYPNGSLCYSWKGDPLLAVVPDATEDGIVWRFCAWEGPETIE